jgi:hypothetical protein
MNVRLRPFSVSEMVALIIRFSSDVGSPVSALAALGQ